MKLKNEGNKIKQKLKEIKYNLHSLKHESTKELYRDRLNNKLRRTVFENIEKGDEYMKTCTSATAIQTQEGGCRKPYWWDEVGGLSTRYRKNETFNQDAQFQTPNDKLAYNQAQAKIRRMMSTKKMENGRTLALNSIHTSEDGIAQNPGGY